jgi:hypothetical protein
MVKWATFCSAPLVAKNLFLFGCEGTGTRRVAGNTIAATTRVAVKVALARKKKKMKGLPLSLPIAPLTLAHGLRARASQPNTDASSRRASDRGLQRTLDRFRDHGRLADAPRLDWVCAACAAQNFARREQ